MESPPDNSADLHGRRSAAWGRFLLLILLLAGWPPGFTGHGAEVVMTESQVKALCLLNFAKYVNWPADAFSQPGSPILIGVLGDPKTHGELKHSAHGKLVGNRPVVVIDGNDPGHAARCHILFVGSGEKARLTEVIEAIGDRPVLSVGDHERFVAAGGAIMFVKRDNKVRFEVNLAAARKARLQISSKLLALADAVHGKGDAGE